MQRRRFRRRNRNNKPAVKTFTRPKQVKTRVNYKQLSKGLRKQNINYGHITNLNRVGEVFPEQLRVKLKCVQYAFINEVDGAGSTNAVEIVYKANSLYNLGGAFVSPAAPATAITFSAQFPSYLNNLLGVNNTTPGVHTALYNKYVVIGSTINVSILSTGDEVSDDLAIALYPSAKQASDSMTLSHVSELPYSRHLINPYQNTFKPQRLYQSLTTKEFLGTGDITPADLEYVGNSQVIGGALDGAKWDPETLWFYRLRVANINPLSTEPKRIKFMVTQMFDVICFSRNYANTDGPQA